MRSVTVEALESRHHLAATALDLSFGTNGTVFAATGRIAGVFGPPTGTQMLCQEVMTDGRIVVAGLVKSTSDLCIARLLPSGQLDTTFGGDGIIDNVPLDFLNDVAVAPDGAVVVLGHEVDSDFRLLRYRPDGSSDIEFGDTGVVDPMISLDGTASIAVDPWGSIYTVGSRTSSTSPIAEAPGYVFQLSRTDVTGYLDTNFGLNGRAYYSLSDGVPNFGAVDVQVDSTGRPIVLTTEGDIVRFYEWGRPDLTFGPRGLATLPWPTSAAVKAFDVAPDDGILVVGDPTESGDRRTFVTKITKEGTADPSIEGMVAAFGSEYIQFRDVEQDRSGTIYLAGISDSQQIAMRLLPSGKVDRSFGRNGGFVVPLPNTSGAYTRGEAITIDRKGALLLGGVYASMGQGQFYSADSGFAVTRIVPSPVPAPPFGTITNRTLAITGTSGADVVTAYNTGAKYVVTLNGVAQSWSSGRINTISIVTGDGNDAIAIGKGIISSLIDSGAGKDRITGGAGADSIYSGTGNDFVDGGEGNDFISTAGGNDRIYGRGGNDRIYGGDGGDTVDAGAGNDRVYGGNGDDLLAGATGRDVLYGELGADSLHGGRGEDYSDDDPDDLLRVEIEMMG